MEDSHQNPRETEEKNIETILSSQDDLENKNIMFIDFPSINSLSVLNEKDMKNSYTMNKRNKRQYSESELAQLRLKNKESAKRSREKKKREYLLLQKEVRLLKKENENFRNKIGLLCPHCQAIFINEQSPLTNCSSINQFESKNDIHISLNINQTFQKKISYFTYYST